MLTEQNKKTGKLVLGLFGAHIGGLLLAIIVTFSFSGMMLGWPGLLLCIPLCLLLFGVAIYSTAWRAGHADWNSARTGEITLHRGHGFRLGVLSCLPFLLFGLVFFVCYLLSAAGILGECTPLIVVYKFINAESWPIINAIEVQAVFSSYTWWKALLAALVPIIPVLIIGVAYLLGTYDISLTQRLIYKETPKQTQDKVGLIHNQNKKGGKAWVTETDSDVTEKPKSSLLNKILYQQEKDKKD